MIRRGSSKPVNHRIKSFTSIFYLAAIATLATSCASLGPPRVQVPCDERFEALLPSLQREAGLEIVGRLRMEMAPYRIRGLLRITYSPHEHAARIDFRHSSLFGAIEEDVTVLVGDSLIIYDRGDGRYFGNDSSLALVEQVMGERITPADILGALLLELPRCEELQSPVIEFSGDSWRLNAIWRDRRIEMRGERGAGVSELGLCFAGARRCYVTTYGGAAPSSSVRYPAKVRLSSMKGEGRAILELIRIKEVALSGALLEGEAIEGR
jgi:hypothetical protein